MQLGTGLSQYETAGDPQALTDFAQAAEQLGYSYVATADNVLDADLTHRPDWDRPAVLPPYFDPFVVFGYLAGLTRRLELFIGVLVLPQRQTALVAKQAAAVDLLSNGRLRLGVGVGWSEPLFQALNEDFRSRGARIDEQVCCVPCGPRSR